MYDGEPNNWGRFLAESDTGHGYYAGLLDVGGGIRPDLVGRGLGAVGLTPDPPIGPGRASRSRGGWLAGGVRGRRLGGRALSRSSGRCE